MASRILAVDKGSNPRIKKIAALENNPIVPMMITGTIGLSTNLEMMYLSRILTTDQMKAAKIDKNIQDNCGMVIGGGARNRTLIAGFGDQCSTVELHPPLQKFLLRFFVIRVLLAMFAMLFHLKLFSRIRFSLGRMDEVVETFAHGALHFYVRFTFSCHMIIR